MTIERPTLKECLGSLSSFIACHREKLGGDYNYSSDGNLIAEKITTIIDTFDDKYIPPTDIVELINEFVLRFHHTIQTSIASNPAVLSLARSWRAECIFQVIDRLICDISTGINAPKQNVSVLVWLSLGLSETFRKYTAHETKEAK